MFFDLKMGVCGLCVKERMRHIETKREYFENRIEIDDYLEGLEVAASALEQGNEHNYNPCTGRVF